MILILCRVKKFPKRWEDTVIIFYVATYVACAALPFALLHKEINFTVNFTSWIWNLLRFLGCLFFGCFVFWPKKTLFYLGCTGIFFFFCDNSRISSWIFWWSISFDFGSNFWKKRLFWNFGNIIISLFGFGIWQNFGCFLLFSQ